MTQPPQPTQPTQPPQPTQPAESTGTGEPFDEDIVPEGLMERLQFTADDVDPDEVPPHIPADTPLAFPADGHD